MCVFIVLKHIGLPDVVLPVSGTFTIELFPVSYNSQK
jgi:hypothetical protein